MYDDIDLQVEHLLSHLKYFLITVTRGFVGKQFYITKNRVQGVSFEITNIFNKYSKTQN